MFARLGGWCYRHRRVVVVLWLALLLSGGALLGTVGTASNAEMTPPNTESSRGLEILKGRFGGDGSGERGLIVFRSEDGIDRPEVRSAVEPFLARIAAIEAVTSVTSPYSPEGAAQISARPGTERTIAYATVELQGGGGPPGSMQVADEFRDDLPVVPGLQVELGGQVFAEFEPPQSELLGVAFAIVILVLAFGSVLAMGLPIGIALAGIGVGSILVGLLSHVTSIPDFSNILGVMIGLGVGIDYALFVVTRFREQLHAGHGVGDAIVIAMDTAGRAVAFAGTTVVISLMGMLAMGVGFVTGLAEGAATVVAVTMAASLTLLPALLGFAGGRVELTRWRGLLAAALVALTLVGVSFGIQPMLLGLPMAVIVLLASLAIAPLRRPVRRRPPKPLAATMAYRWSRFVQRNPWPSAVGGAALLLVLTIPLLSLRLGFSDESNYPKDTTTRKAYDLLVEGFGPGFNGPLLLVTELPGRADRSALDRVTAALSATDGVAFATPAVTNSPSAPTAALWRVIPTTAPQDAATDRLVERLRTEVIPPATRGTDLDVAVTGTVAANVDFSDYLAKRLPLFFAAVLTMSFLLLMSVFRSLLVPLKAVVMNLLSIGAAFGAAVAIFQWGWGAGLLGVGGAPIEPFIPMMLFAIVFGLSMDYEVFLLSRVREEWQRTHDNSAAVANGLAATARVITAAAAIMVFVFGSFLLENDRIFKLFGSGLAMAVLIDATVVRLLLVPATMELLGSRNWWLPAWLDRLLPRLDVEGSNHLDPFDDEVLDGRPLEPV